MRWTDLRALQLDRPLRVWINLGAPEVAGADEVLGRIKVGDRRRHAQPPRASASRSPSRAARGPAERRRRLVDAARARRARSPSTTSAPATRRCRTCAAAGTTVKIDRSFVAGIGALAGRRGDRRGGHRPGPRARVCGSSPKASRTSAQADALRPAGRRRGAGLPVRAAGADRRARRPRRASLGRSRGLRRRRPPGGPRAPRPARGPLPGYGSPQSRLLLAALDTAHDAIVVTTRRAHRSHRPRDRLRQRAGSSPTPASMRSA